MGRQAISLAVKDIAASKDFYEKLGFAKIGGDQAQHWLIMKNGDTIVGLFQGMFEHNILTFNPGGDRNAKHIDPFTDVRELQRQLRIKGISFATEAEESTSGPAGFVLTDPDGNTILVDQHR